MMRQVLKRIARGGAVSVDEIATDLGVAPGLAQQMVEDLGRMGFLACNDPGCAAYCAWCLMEGTCPLRLQPRMWALTRKGKTFLSRAASIECSGRETHTKNDRRT